MFFQQVSFQFCHYACSVWLTNTCKRFGGVSKIASQNNPLFTVVMDSVVANGFIIWLCMDDLIQSIRLAATLPIDRTRA